LRNYVFSEGWKDNNKTIDEDNYATYTERRDAKIQNEDDARDNEMEDFEEKYNFRYEDKNAAYLTTHGRDPPEDSMRRVDDRRKQQRQTAKEKKEE